MNSTVILIGSIILFIIAYFTYGRHLKKSWNLNNTNATPAHKKDDGVDYVPAKAPVLLGHHFASIAGAAPIIGPIAASTFGWGPVLLWIIIGGIFIGAVHDMGSLITSVRSGGQSIGAVINENVGKTEKNLFSIFAWLTLILVISAFMVIVAQTFAATPTAATSSILFIILAIVFGLMRNKTKFSLTSLTILGVILLFTCVAIGLNFPLQMSKATWLVIFVIYIFLSSVTPVWILLQPRDYLNSFLLYTLLIGGFLGLIMGQPDLKLAAVTSFKTSTGHLFPILFVTVACGAISGFHSLVASGTTSKQLDKETDAQLIGYGGMLIECALAVIALLTAAVITREHTGKLLANGGPVNVFSRGIGRFVSNLGISAKVGTSFAALAVSAFALTTLDTATRLGRFIFQEYFEAKDREKEKITDNIYFATLVTVAFASFLAFTGGWETIWPIFGSANQMLAALALLSLSVWLAKKQIYNLNTIIPMVFMSAVTLAALALLIIRNFVDGSLVLAITGVLLFILAIVLAKQSYQHLFSKKENK